MKFTHRIAPYESDEYLSSYYYANGNFVAKSVLSNSHRYMLETPSFIALDIGGKLNKFETKATLDLTADDTWDFGQSIETWQAGHEYSEGDWVRPTSIADGSLNTSTDYATPAMKKDFFPVGKITTSQSFEATPYYLRCNAFDRMTHSSYGWLGLNPATLPLSICFEFTSPIIINSYRWLPISSFPNPTAWSLQGSHDITSLVSDSINSSKWTNLDTQSGFLPPGPGTFTSYFTFINGNDYLKYRFVISAVQNNNLTFPGIAELHLVAQPQLVYRCTTAGTSHSSEPSWGTTVSGTTTETGGVEWTAYYDDTVAINRAGQDYYIYACQSNTTAPKLIASRNSTYPSGYTANNSRKIGGFHCLCNSVGTISGHDLSGYLTGDILPRSVWDLNWRAKCGINSGLVYSSKLQKWVGIYLLSGSTSAPVCVYGGTVLNTVTWFGANNCAKLLNMKLPKDYEFQVFASGSPELVNVYGSINPVTANGYVSTGSVRMISHIGCECCVGHSWQWLDEQSYRYDTDANWSWKNQTGGKGQLHVQGDYGTVKLAGGGNYNSGIYSGSCGRDFALWPWTESGDVSIRLVSDHIDRGI